MGKKWRSRRKKIFQTRDTATFIVSTMHCFQFYKEASLNSRFHVAFLFRIFNCARLLKPSNQSSCLHQKHNIALKQRFLSKLKIFMFFCIKEIKEKRKKANKKNIKAINYNLPKFVVKEN